MTMAESNNINTYKLRKEQFYSGHSGGSSAEIIAISMVTPCSVLCIQAIELAFGGRIDFYGKYLVNFGVVVLPMYASFVFPEYSVVLSILMLIFTLLLLRFKRVQLRSVKLSLEDVEGALNDARNPFIAAYRGTMMLATCIAILAVDFQNFPRRLAKTETFGVSLMDAGVGSILLTQAMVSPLARNPSSAAPKRLLSAFISAIPLVLLGCVRLLGTRAADYHEHASEYGVHWNFFFTLAMISIVANALPLPLRESACAAIVINITYELLSHVYGLKNYILTAPRTDLLSANREGIFGCVGYTSIYFSGAVLGYQIFAVKRTGNEWIKFGFILLSFACMLWGARIFLLILGFEESRRLVNFAYVLWNLAYNVLILCMFMAGEVVLHFLQAAQEETITSMRKHRMGKGELLSEGINRNMLAIFLMANLLTGLVNISVNTLDASGVMASSIVLLYSAMITAVSMWLNHARITLKFW